MHQDFIIIICCLFRFSLLSFLFMNETRHVGFAPYGDKYKYIHTYAYWIDELPQIPSFMTKLLLIAILARL